MPVIGPYRPGDGLFSGQFCPGDKRPPNLRYAPRNLAGILNHRASSSA